MTSLYIVYSLDPRGWIDVYPKWICELFTEAYTEYLESGTPLKLELGAKFFGVTINFGNVDPEKRYHHQTTLNGGYRSVACIPFQGQKKLRELMYKSRQSQDRGGGWRFRTRESEAEFQEIEAEVPPEFFRDDCQISKTPIWQWSKLTDDGLAQKKMDGLYDRSVTLKRLPDNDWVSYRLDISDKLEVAWNMGASDFSLEVGLRQYKIIFDYNRIFAKQRDILDTTRVRMVRRNPNMTRGEVENSIKEWEKLDGRVTEGELCSLCYDPFVAHMPMVTLTCKHQFHCSCLQPMLIKNLREHYGDSTSLVHHCPLCRGEFTSQEYTDKTGDTINITNNYNIEGYGLR